MGDQSWAELCKLLRSVRVANGKWLIEEMTGHTEEEKVKSIVLWSWVEKLII